jgi:hypothetical protein
MSKKKNKNAGALGRAGGLSKSAAKSAAARKNGIQHYFIEDESPTSMDQIPASLKFLRTNPDEAIELDEIRRRVARCLSKLTKIVTNGVNGYRDAYQALTEGKPAAFQKFLKSAAVTVVVVVVTAITGIVLVTAVVVLLLPP